MIIGTSLRFKVGEIVCDPNRVITDQHGIDHQGPVFRIMREATFEEYIAYCKEVCPPTSMLPTKAECIELEAAFYEIGID